MVNEMGNNMVIVQQGMLQNAICYLGLSKKKFSLSYATLASEESSKGCEKTMHLPDAFI